MTTSLRKIRLKSLNKARIKVGTSLVFAAAIAMFLICAPETWAHKVNVFAYVENDKIVVEGYFSGKAKAVDCTVRLFDAAGNRIHEGKTDSAGLYTVKTADLSKLSGDIRIVLSSSDGHKSEFMLSPQDSDQAVKNQSQTSGVTAALQDDKGTRPGIVDESQLIKTVEAIVDARVRKLLAERKDNGPSLVEIIGGIGWVLGIVGVWAYFAAGNKTAEKRTS